VPLPVPVPDALSEPYWAALREHRIVVQVCPACDRRRIVRLPSCPYCAAEGGRDLEVPGTGVVYSFIRAHRALTPAAADDVPYAIATVDLDGGARVIARVEPADAVAIGLALAPVFVDHHDWTELRFVPRPI
jgi:uncharacterized OB-fold protein